jgi:hypothetical protein
VAEKINLTVEQYADSVIPAALVAEICPELALAPLVPAEIHRYLGYPREGSPAPPMAEQIAQVVVEAQLCLRPRGAYAVYPAPSRTAHSLQLGDTTISGSIGEYLKDAERVAVFAVTAGEEISLLSESAAKSRDAFSALVMDAVGSWAAEAAADALMLHMRRHLRDEEELTLRYSPGYCGMEISQQRKLFQLVPAEAVGVRLLPSLLMYPLKSISGLVGLAPKEAVSSYRSPCDHCPRTGCHMRR